MAGSAHIHEMRFSFIWFAPHLDLLAGQITPNANFSFLQQRATIEAQYGAALARPPQGLQPPWPQQHNSRFWRYYLQGANLTAPKPPDLFRGLVPFWSAVPMRATGLGVDRLRAEGFYYPNGLALMITAVIARELTLTEAVEAALGLHHRQSLAVTWPASGQSENLPLQGLAVKAIQILRQNLAGNQSFAVAATSEPYSLVTIIKGAGIDPTTAIVNLSEVHRTLAALTTWSDTWQQDQLPDVAHDTVPARSLAPAGHLIYGRKRGRTIWFPGLFGATGGPIRALGCYHRNLALLSLQVESLIHLVEQTARLLDSGAAINYMQGQCVRLAAGLLARLYFGQSDTYRSQSAQRQINDNLGLTAWNRVRIYLGQPAIAE
jgi:hypothetical protein